MGAHLPFLADPDAARSYLESRRWPGGPVCPHCAGPRVISLRAASARPGLWKCSSCLRQFTVTVRTVFEDTKIPLHKWLQAIDFLVSSRPGATARDLQLHLAISYKTSWKLLDRIRYAFSRPRRPSLRPVSLHPLTLDRAVDRLLSTLPERKHPQSLERAASRFRQ